MPIGETFAPAANSSLPDDTVRVVRTEASTIGAGESAKCWQQAQTHASCNSTVHSSDGERERQQGRGTSTVLPPAAGLAGRHRHDLEPLQRKHRQQCRARQTGGR